MKTQLKKGVLEIYVLMYLTDKSSYGYEIITELNNYIEITESTLYPILRRLEQALELKTYNEIHNGRNRKYYTITNKGKAHINEFIKEWNEITKNLKMLSEKEGKNNEKNNEAN